MAAAELAARWRAVRLEFFRWRAALSVAEKVALSAGMAVFTGLVAQVRIPLPFTPVPITGQVFAVLLAGVLLGGTYGALSQLMYVAAGAAGLPWFAGWAGGLPLGPTGGYLFGFIPAAALIGWLTERHIKLRSLAGQASLMMLAVGVIYLFGAVQFALVMRTGLWATLVGAVLPFIGVDAIKALAVACLSNVLLPKES